MVQHAVKETKKYVLVAEEEGVNEGHKDDKVGGWLMNTGWSQVRSTLLGLRQFLTHNSYVLREG